MSLHPAYFETCFRCDGPAPAWPARFAIVSACATTGERWDAAREAAADARLRAAIRARRVWHTRVTGYSPTTGHAEPGWAVALPFDEARALGAAFAQDAIYWVDGDALGVGRCLGDGALTSVGGFRDRVRAVLPRPVVDPALLNTTEATRWTNLGWWDPVDAPPAAVTTDGTTTATDTPTRPRAAAYPDAARHLARRVGEAARLRAGDVVVDVACGHGDSLALWVTAFGAARVVGVEPDPTVCAAVRARLDAWGLADRVTIVAETAETFDLVRHAPDATAVVCVDAAYHFRTRTAWLRGIAAAAAPGTRLGFSDLARTGVDPDAAHGTSAVPPSAGGVQMPRALRRAATRAGIPADNLWELRDVPDTLTASGYASITVTECGGPILDGFRGFARRSRGAWLARPQHGGWQALATAWLLGRVRPMLTMVRVGAQVAPRAG